MIQKNFLKKTALFLALMLVFSTFTAFPSANAMAASTASVEIQQSGGDFETAYVTWKAVTNATEYRAYVASAGSNNFTRLDNELVRNYGDYFRADAVGIKGGNYVLKVEAYNGASLISSAVTGTIAVAAHDRSGYAFVNGTSSGAYNEDGTLRSNAVVVYITEQTKDSVKMDVVTSSKGATTPCTGIVEILAAYKKGYETRPLAIRVIGKVTNSGAMTSTKDNKGDLLIDTNKKAMGITVEGIGNDAVAFGWGVRIKNAANIEVRNLGFMACNSGEGDNVGLQQDNDHIWIHNNDMFYGMAGGDADQAKGDGALDTKKSTYVTHSYNHFWDCGKCNLLGLSEGTTEGLFITYHHNWYDHSDSRHPRVRYYSAHVYNNYYDGNAKYGVGATLGSSVFVENNYFRNCQYPILTSMQGSDVFAGGTKRDVTNNATFSKENGGNIKASGNIMVGKYTFIPYGASTYTLKGNEVAFNLTGTTSTQDFDAIVLDRNEKVDGSIHAYTGGATYNNFDTSGSFYSYKADKAEDVPAIVAKWAGRAYGGDFTWTWNNAADDFDYGVNKALKAAIVGYTSKLLYVGGGAVAPTSTPAPATATPTPAATQAPGSTATPTPVQGSSGNVAPAGTTVHNFTTDGLKSSIFTISGNLSTSKGTESYNGLTLTQCLKIESATSISFTTAGSASLTLVFNSAFNGKIKIDGNSLAAVNGILTTELEAGNHTITKVDSTNLYYMVLANAGNTGNSPTPAATATPVPTSTPVATEAPVNTPVPTEAPKPTDSAVSTPAPTEVPVNTPVPTEQPANTPVVTETPVNTKAPTSTPAASTPAPTEAPAPTDPLGNTTQPTDAPINIPGLITATPTPTAAEATPTPAPEVTNTPVPTPTEAPVATPTDTPAATEPKDSNNTAIYIIIIVVLALAAAGVIGFFAVKAVKKK